MPKYTIKKGFENRVFSQEGVRRISDTEIESDSELNSSYLILQRESDQMTVEKPAVAVAAPVLPVVNSNPPQPASAAGVTATQTQSQGGTN